MKPDFLKPTGRVCPKHLVPTYMVNGIEKCGACSLFRAKKQHRETMNERINDEVLTEYNNNKYLKKK